MGIATNAEDYFDQLKLRLFRRMGKIDPIQIVPYRGFGYGQQVYLKGRVLEDKGLKPSADNDTVWDNLLATYRRFESDEIPGVRIRARFEGMEEVVVTDDEGYFEVRLSLAEPLLPTRAWYDMELELLDEVVPGQGPVITAGQILVLPPSSLFGIISDVDDTVLKTDATSLLKMARLTFFNNARTRLPFEGVSAFYRALQSGPDQSLFNPIFYVSSSSWNLYDLLVDFCSVHGIPKGPFFLRDIGFDKNNLLRSSHLSHKMLQIEHIMGMYPHLPFILIGDSGQHDPEIYRQVVKDFPGRIRAIYIREVTTEVRRQQVDELTEALKSEGVEMLLVKDTVEAAIHAAERGYIDAETIPEIRAAKKVDEGLETDPIFGSE